MRVGLISLIVLLILPASYSAVTLTIEQAPRRDQTVCRKRVHQLYGLLIKSTSQVTMNWS